MEQKRLTPLQAIHAMCVRCMGGNPNLVREGCTYKACPIYSRRTGESPHDGTKTLKQIRAFCIECRGMDSKKEVDNCNGRLADCFCPLHEFRMGKNPARKGKGGRGVSAERMRELQKMANSQRSKNTQA